jgi:hypothetical protein
VAEEYRAGVGKFLEWFTGSLSGVAEIGGSRTRRESGEAKFSEVLDSRNGDAHMGSPVRNLTPTEQAELLLEQFAKRAQDDEAFFYRQYMRFFGAAGRVLDARYEQR